MGKHVDLCIYSSHFSFTKDRSGLRGDNIRRTYNFCYYINNSFLNLNKNAIRSL